MPRLLALAAILLPGAALAQPVTGPVIPPGGNPIPQLAPTRPPNVGPGLAPSGTPAPVGDLAGSVAVRGVVIEGATAFPESRLAAATGALTGPAVPVATLENARAAVVALYRESGYPFVTADAVLGADGNLRIRVARWMGRMPSAPSTASAVTKG